MRLTGRLPRAAVIGLAAFSAAALAAGLGRAAVTTYLPVALERIHDAPGLIGVVMLVNVAAGFAVPLWVGIWSDRLHARGHSRTLPFILGGSVVTSGGLLAIAAGTGTSYLALAGAALVAYVGLNAITTAHRALIAEAYPEDRRAAATGAEELAMMLGTTVGVAMGGVLVEWHTWAPFAAAAVAVPLVAAPTVRRMRGREPDGEPLAGETRAPLRYYMRVAARPGVSRVLLAQGLWVLGYAALPSFFVLYADHVLGLRPAAAGGLLVAFGAICGLTMLLAGLENRPERHLPLLALGIVLMGGGLLAMVPVDAAAEAIPGLACAAVGFGLLSTLGFPVVSRYIPPGEAGAYTAVYFSVRSVAGAIALPAAGGTIAATGSYRSLVGFGGVAVLLALVPIAPLAGWPGRRAWARVRALRGPDRHALGRWALRLGGLAAAMLVVGLVVEHTALVRLDRAVFRLFNDAGPGPGIVDTLIVGPDVRNYVILAGGTLAAALLWRRGRVIRSCAEVILAGLIAWGLVRAIWTVWDRPRPQETLDGVAVGVHNWTSYQSFPSGHMAVWLAMALVIIVVFPRSRVPLLALLLAVAVTRMVGGAHYPSDLLGAAVLGWGAARASLALVASAEARRPGTAGDANDATTILAESRTGRKELTSSP
jgi:membrane-associated phospholipid phosphatase/predicted MFS family arabinose efflux permease